MNFPWQIPLFQARSIIEEAKKLDKKTSICPTPGRGLGVQQSIRNRICKVISHLVESDPSFTEYLVV